MKQKTLVIMAAGKGTRFGSIKQLYAITKNGYSILDFSIYDAINVGFNRIIFIVAKETLAIFKDRYTTQFPKHITVLFIVQELESVPKQYKKIAQKRNKPWGTGHVLTILKNHISNSFAIINADDFYGRKAFELIYEALFDFNSNDNYFIGYHLDNTLSENGTVSRGECFLDKEGYLIRVIERHGIIRRNNSGIIFKDNTSESEITMNAKTIVSMNVWGFNLSIFDYVDAIFERFLKSAENLQIDEFYIAYVVEHLIGDCSLKFKMLSTDENWYGVTYLNDADLVSNQISRLIENGIYPENMKQND